jgi:uncharacterized protein
MLAASLVVVRNDWRRVMPPTVAQGARRALPKKGLHEEADLMLVANIQQSPDQVTLLSSDASHNRFALVIIILYCPPEALYSNRWIPMRLLMTAAMVLGTMVASHAQSEQPPTGDRQALAPSSKCFEDEPAVKKVADIRLFIEVSGVFDTKQTANSVFEQLRPFMDEMDSERSDRLKQFEAKFFERVLSAFDSKSCQIVKALIPVYDELFTEKEVRGLVQFYQSPLGQRYVEARPKLAAHSMDLGQELMLEILPGIMKELAEEFPEVMQQHLK